MYDYDYYDEPPYYEPTIADEIIEEYRQKMKDVLLESIKLDIENIKRENERLKEENKKLKERSFKVNNKERRFSERDY